MSGTDILVTPLTPIIGAEISGVDLSARLSAAAQDSIYQALLDHLVIFIRDQEISPERHLAFAESFGELDLPHPVYPHVPGHDRIVKLANDEDNPPGTDEWHTDLTFKQDPPFASVLVAREVPATGGDTLWRNMYAVYDDLPKEMKSYLEPLKAVHEMGSFRNRFTKGETTGEKLLEGMQRFGCAIHDVVKIHPVTGRKFLYINESFTSHIEGESTRESRRILDYLIDRMGRPEFQVRFNWRTGSMAMWDNRCTQHYAVADYAPAFRCMNRVTVVKDRRVENASTEEGVRVAV